MNAAQVDSLGRQGLVQEFPRVVLAELSDEPDLRSCTPRGQCLICALTAMMPAETAGNSRFPWFRYPVELEKQVDVTTTPRCQDSCRLT